MARVRWQELEPHRDGVRLRGRALRGHLWHWRQGTAAADFDPGRPVQASQVDWSDFPAECPEGYEKPPTKRHISGAGAISKKQEDRTRKMFGATVSVAAYERLQAIAFRRGAGISETLDALILAAPDR